MAKLITTNSFLPAAQSPLIDSSARQLIGQSISQQGAISVQESKQLAQDSQETFVKNRRAMMAHRAFVENMQRSKANALANKALSGAAQEYQQQVQDRLTQTVDEHGLPTFDTIPDDVANIAKTIKNNYLGNLRDSSSATLFSTGFDHFTSSNLPAVLSTARQQQVDFSKASTVETIHSIGHSAGNDSFTNFPQYAHQVQGLLKNAIADGSMSATEAITAQEQFRQLNLKNINATIMRDPGSALNQLTNSSHDQVGLTKPEYDIAVQNSSQQLLRIKEAQQKDAEAKQAKVAAQSEKQRHEAVSTLEAGVSLGLESYKSLNDPNQAGPAQEALNQLVETHGDILKPAERLNLLSKIQSGVADGLKQNAQISKVENALSSKQNMYQFSGQELDQWYNSRLQQVDPAAPPEAKIIVGANLAAQANVEIPAVSKQLDNAMKFGNIGEKFAAATSIVSLIQQNPHAVDSIPKETIAQAYQAKNMVGLAGMDPGKVFNDIKQQDADSGDPVKAKILETNIQKAMKDFDWESVAKENAPFFSLVKVDPQAESIFKSQYEANLRYTRADSATALQMTIDQAKNWAGESDLTDAMQKGLRKTGTQMFMPPEQVGQGVPNNVAITHSLLEEATRGIIPKGYSVNDIQYTYQDTNNRYPGMSAYKLFILDSEGKSVPIVDKLGRQQYWYLSRAQIVARANAMGHAEDHGVQYVSPADQQPENNMVPSSMKNTSQPSLLDMVRGKQ